MILMKKIKIGESDYNRNQIESGTPGAIGGQICCDSMLEKIRYYENNGYTVQFQTSIFRKIFLLGKYKVVATK